MHKVLKDTGSFYLHCDQTMSHYLKIVCDLIFNANNFRNEIIWCYKRWPAKQTNFQKMHDIILRYAKSDNLIWNQLYDDFTKQTKKRIKGGKKIEHYVGKSGKILIRATEQESPGVAMCDYWNIPMIAGQGKERLGFPTQKPEQLLERIVTASSNENDLVADFFGGCGTTVAVSQKLKRHWFCVDISHLAIGLIEKKRLIEPYGIKIKSTYEIHGFPQDIASAKKLSLVKGGRFEFQDWIIESKLRGVHNPKKTADGGWDGHVTFDFHGKKDIVLIEVKSGHVNVKNLREFIHVVNAQKASIGVLVCFAEQVTKPMLLEAKNQGYYRKELFGDRYDKIQILTVEDILDEKEIQRPISTKETFKTAEIVKEQSDQEKLF